MVRRWLTPLLAVALATAGSACAGSARASDARGPVPVRLGYFANLTHAPAIAGIARGTVASALGDGAHLESHTFNAGPEIVQGLFSGALDAAFIGPGPAALGFVRSGGRGLRIVAGATGGGAALVVRSGVASPADLRGATLASPQLGNTQDVALRTWLGDQGFATDTQGGGDVHVRPQANADTLAAFRDGSIDGAWVPEPWASRLVIEGGGHVLVDEADLWPGRRFATTVLVVAPAFADAHPDLVEALVRATVDTDRWLTDHPRAGRDLVGAEITRITGERLSPAVLARAWRSLTFTPDPLLATVRASATHAASLGLIPDDDIDGIADLSVLESIRAAGVGR